MFGLGPSSYINILTAKYRIDVFITVLGGRLQGIIWHHSSRGRRERRRRQSRRQVTSRDQQIKLRSWKYITLEIEFTTFLTILSLEGSATGSVMKFSLFLFF